MGMLLAVFLFGISVFYIASYRESNQLCVREYAVCHKHIKKEKTVVFFSDVHIGKWYHSHHLPALCAKINHVHPDIVILGGDFIDHYKRDKERLNMEEIASVRREIRCSHKFCVMGNHDGTAYRQLMKSCGFTMLENRQVCVEDVAVIGLEDALLGYPSFADMEFGDDRFRIAVIHEPDAVDELDHSHIHLFLSGHTHGGQVGIPVLKDMVLPDKGKRYVKGRYMLSKTCQIIVSSGIGRTSLPLRLGNTPEILVLRLHPKV